MPKRYALFFSLLLVLLPIGAHAQDTPPATTKTSRFLTHFDLGLSGTALITKSANGTVNEPAVVGSPYPLTYKASSAAGALVTLRGEKSPYKGLELNYGYGRVTTDYNCCNTFGGDFQSQVTHNEITAGYLARPPHPIFGFQPYVSAGAGVSSFNPTRNGGQGLQKQARATYYYSAGLEDMIVGDRLGIRLGVRQLFYLAPDFDQNYLRIKKFTFTTEPQFGLYVHF
jgi:hypothetical protein